MNGIKKAVIPAAGLGIRFLPVTKSMPKEMLPIINIPAIHYVVKEAILSDIEEIIIITGRGKRAIEDYFDSAPELEMHLKNRKKDDLLKVVRDVSSLIDINYIRQKEPRGLGDAILKAKNFIGNEPFAVLLGDDIIQSAEPGIKQLINVYQKTQCSVIAVNEIPSEKISSYGIIRGKKLDNSLYLIEDIVEKPKLEEAPSNMGAIGRYIFTPEIFDCLKNTAVGIHDELQLTDAIGVLKDRQNVYGYNIVGKRYDVGDKVGYVQAIIEFSLGDEEIRESMVDFLKTLPI